MFEVPIDSFLNIFKYACIVFGILFAIAILSRHLKIAIYIFFLAFYIGLIWSLFTGTGAIDCVCERQINNVVTCERTRYIFYGLLKEEQLISPLEGVELKDYSERTEIHLRSQGKSYLLYTGHYYSPLQLFPVQNITEDLEELIAGKEEPIRYYHDGGGIVLSILSTLIIGFLMLLLGGLFFFWVRPTFRDFPWLNLPWLHEK